MTSKGVSCGACGFGSRKVSKKVSHRKRRSSRKVSHKRRGSKKVSHRKKRLSLAMDEKVIKRIQQKNCFTESFPC